MFFNFNSTKNSNYTEYKLSRDELIKKNEDRWFHLNFKEDSAGKEAQAYKLMDNHRAKLINSHNNFNTVFPPMQPFYAVKNIIDNDKLFKLFKGMPKGGILHLHTSATADATWIVEQVLNKDYPNNPIYIYLKEEDPTGINASKYVDRQLIFHSNISTDSKGFKKVKEAAKIITDFKNKMIDLLTFSSSRIEQIPYIWNEFNTIFQRTSELLKNHEFYYDYYKRAFEILIDDNIQYVELRSNFATFSPNVENKFFLDVLEEARNQICNEKSKSLTLKIILCGNRSKNLTIEDVMKKLRDAISLKSKDKYKNMIVGFDIVGEEDRGRPTEEYIEQIFTENLHNKIDFYFHDGESNWSSNNNIIAAYLMSEKRVGHGFNLNRFPYLIDRILTQCPEIEAEEKFPFAIEICPISNQLLRYFPDLRNHTAYELMKRGIQCVIASDDPQIFENHGLSYDFWEVFVGFGVNLMAIKKLVFNSINYSAMPVEEKRRMRINVDNEWIKFVDRVIAVLKEDEISIDNVLINKMAKVTINKRICHKRLSENENISTNSIEYITIHFTNNYNPTATARAYAEYLYSGEKGISADYHYIVDKDEIWQTFEDTQICNYCDDGFNGDVNTTSIGVAICVNDKTGFSKACLNSAHLVAELLREHNISIKNVVPHHYWSSTDYSNELWNGIWNITWDNFVEMVRDCIKEAEIL